MKFAFIRDSLAREYPVSVCCLVLSVSSSGYYAFIGRPQSGREKRRRELSVKIHQVYAEHRSIYGSPRVHAALKQQGVCVNVKTVAGIMKQSHLQGKKKRKFVPKTTDSNHRKPVVKNLLDRKFTATGPNQKWTSDITYIQTDEGWLYLAGVMDLYSRKIVGWALADHMRGELTQEALKMALEHRRIPKSKKGRKAKGKKQSGSKKGVGSRKLLHHSDQGVQYADDAYVKLLKDHGILMSMSHKGDCWDNAVTESFWASLKCELMDHKPFKSHQEASLAIFEYIEVFYNRKRLHSALGYLSPDDFEAQRK